MTGSINPAISQQMSKEELLVGAYTALEKCQDEKTETFNLLALLEQYIIAQMKGDPSGTQQIASEIRDSVRSFETNIKNANDLFEQVKLIVANPDNWTESNLQQLQGILENLQKTVKS
jgi:archaellum component FlaC